MKWWEVVVNLQDRWTVIAGEHKISFLSKVFAEVCIRSPQPPLNEKLFNFPEAIDGEIITQEGCFMQCRKRIISSESNQMTEEGQDVWPFEEVRKSSTPENLPHTHYHLWPEFMLPSPTQQTRRWVAGARKASRRIRWWAHVPKKQCCLNQDSSFFYTKRVGVKSNTPWFWSDSWEDVLISSCSHSQVGLVRVFLWAKKRYFSLMLITCEAGFPEMGHYV